MLSILKKYLKYWWIVHVLRVRYTEVHTLKDLVFTLPPVDVGGIKLARGMKPIWFSEKELRKQGKIPVGQPIRFPVDGCVEKAISRKMSKLIFLDFLETNAYRILNIERYEDGSCFITIQPYNVKK